MAKMDRKQVRLDKRQQKWLKRTAKARGVPQAEIVREAIDWYIAAQAEGGPAAKQKRAPKRGAASRPARRPSPRSPKASPPPATPAADSPSKWRGDDPHEERLRQIEQLTR